MAMPFIWRVPFLAVMIASCRQSIRAARWVSMPAVPCLPQHVWRLASTIETAEHRMVLSGLPALQKQKHGL